MFSKCKFHSIIILLSYYDHILIYFRGAPSDPPKDRFSGDVKSGGLPDLEPVPVVTSPQSTPQKATNLSKNQTNQQTVQPTTAQPTVQPTANQEIITLQLMAEKPAVPTYQFKEFAVMDSFNESIFKYNLPMSYIDKDGSRYIGQVWELGKSKFIFQESKF